uniref:Uncharacterized protein n=1 Tax=Rhizophora mucronata TaxID=61149 RepID=A0A2P2QXE5_RHIMU
MNHSSTAMKQHQECETLNTHICLGKVTRVYICITSSTAIPKRVSSLQGTHILFLHIETIFKTQTCDLHG